MKSMALSIQPCPPVVVVSKTLAARMPPCRVPRPGPRPGSGGWRSRAGDGGQDVRAVPVLVVEGAGGSVVKLRPQPNLFRST